MTTKQIVLPTGLVGYSSRHGLVTLSVRITADRETEDITARLLAAPVRASAPASEVE